MALSTASTAAPSAAPQGRARAHRVMMDMRARAARQHVRVVSSPVTRHDARLTLSVDGHGLVNLAQIPNADLLVTRAGCNHSVISIQHGLVDSASVRSFQELSGLSCSDIPYFAHSFWGSRN